MKTAFFYHVRLSGGHNVDSGVSIDPIRGMEVFSNQTNLMRKSGLFESLSKVVICVNGTQKDFESVELLQKTSVVSVLHNGENVESLLPTIRTMQEWASDHLGWAVGFAHMKGVTHSPQNGLVQRWADCLNHHTITNWRQNVADLESGQYDACGCHWTHNSPNDQNAHDWGANSYFAGGFFWTTTDYLATLPLVPERPHNRHQWFKGELLIGCGNPRVKDYHPGACTVHA